MVNAGRPHRIVETGVAVARHPVARIAPPAPAIISASRARVGEQIWSTRAPLTELLKPDGCRAPPRSSHRAAGARHHQRLARASG